jgi:hypothetical protein
MSTQSKEDKNVSFFVGILIGFTLCCILHIISHIVYKQSIYDEKENTCVIKNVTPVKVKN